MPSKRPAPAERECEAPDCAVRFTPPRSDAKYHAKTCRQRAARARKAAECQQVEDSKTGTAEHGLVRAVRSRLMNVEALDTVNGQLALELARRAVDQASPLVAMAKELDARITAAIAEAGHDADPAAAGTSVASAESDEVRKAREARDRKRAALGEAPAG